jgi:hypothetical protein
MVLVRDAPPVKNELSRRLLTRFDEAGLSVASATPAATVGVGSGLWCHG